MAAKYDEDAFSYLNNQLRQWGLSSLSGEVRKMLEAGATADRVQIELQETTAYKQRFSGNEARKQKGLPVLSPAEYLSVESSYRQVMEAANMPSGFYDRPSDFTKWIADDVSPTEIQGRVQVAQQLVESADPAWRSQFKSYYGDGDLVAYALDRNRTVELLKKRAEAARIATAGTDVGFGTLHRSSAERLAEAGISAEQSRAGFAEATRRRETFGRLGGVAGSGGGYSHVDSFEEVFFADEDAAGRARGLASQERARFAGSSGLSGSSLTTRSTGAL